MDNIDVISDCFPDEMFLFADGFDGAIIGVYNNNIVYSKTKCIDILVNRDKMTTDEAMEYFDYNVECAYVGESTPIFINDTMF